MRISADGGPFKRSPARNCVRPSCRRAVGVLWGNATPPKRSRIPLNQILGLRYHLACPVRCMLGMLRSCGRPDAIGDGDKFIRAERHTAGVAGDNYPALVLSVDLCVTVSPPPAPCAVCLATCPSGATRTRLWVKATHQQALCCQVMSH